MLRLCRYSTKWHIYMWPQRKSVYRNKCSHNVAFFNYEKFKLKHSLRDAFYAHNRQRQIAFDTQECTFLEKTWQMLTRWEIAVFQMSGNSSHWLSAGKPKGKQMDRAIDWCNWTQRNCDYTALIILTWNLSLRKEREREMKNP